MSFSSSPSRLVVHADWGKERSPITYTLGDDDQELLTPFRVTDKVRGGRAWLVVRKWLVEQGRL